MAPRLRLFIVLAKPRRFHFLSVTFLSKAESLGEGGGLAHFFYNFIFYMQSSGVKKHSSSRDHEKPTVPISD